MKLSKYLLFPILLFAFFLSCEEEIHFYSDVQRRVWDLEQDTYRIVVYESDSLDIKLIETPAQVLQFTRTFQSNDSIGIAFVSNPTEAAQSPFNYSVIHRDTILFMGSSKETISPPFRYQEALKVFVFE